MEGILPDTVRCGAAGGCVSGPRLLDAAIAARFTHAEALTATRCRRLAPFVDLRAWRAMVERFDASRDPIEAASIWQTLLLARWLRAYDARAHPVGAAALSPRVR
jgi:hypothetical protein